MKQSHLVIAGAIALAAAYFYFQKKKPDTLGAIAKRKIDSGYMPGGLGLGLTGTIDSVLENSCGNAGMAGSPFCIGYTTGAL